MVLFKESNGLYYWTNSLENYTKLEVDAENENLTMKVTLYVVLAFFLPLLVLFCIIIDSG